MDALLRSERNFLWRPLNLTSRLLLVAAAAAIIASFFFPLWRMHLFAPQYEEGLSLYIYSHKIQGGGIDGADLNEINTLNHYIGMKPLRQADFFEMQWMPFVFGLIILLLLRAAVFGQMANVVDVFTLFSYFGVFSIGAFYYRLYIYGHQLDPEAPMKIKPFTPLLIGTKQIANFTEHSYPQFAAYLLIAAVSLVFLAGWFSRNETV
ncbi:MAG: hypothetical protein FGM15_12140 [Chthoniobacterales bacterium]|nr:hypothetical protein [Chthoniobacterales bacterium]